VPDLDPLFHALSDGTRRRIVARLSEGPASVSQIAGPLAISLPAVMQHLRVLEDSGIVRSQKAGRTRTCTLDAGALIRAETWIADRRRMWSDRLDRLEAFLAAEDAAPAPPARGPVDARGDPPGDPPED
jgi:DNA-binding transcriptional ArsR family regulator